MKLAFCDEITGGRIAGFTVRDTETGEATLVKTVDQIEADAWASVVELLVWLSRSPEFWGEAATSATFRVWARDAQAVVEVQVPRKGTESPLDR